MGDAMLRLVLVFLGGGAGACARYGITLGAIAMAGPRYPWGTLVCNVAGCAAAGAILVFAVERGQMSAATRTLLMTGFLGGLTTFSAMGFETVVLARAEGLPAAAINVVLNVGLSLAGVMLGVAAARSIAG